MSPAELSILLNAVLPFIVAITAIGTVGKIIAIWMTRGGKAPKELQAISEQLNQLQQAVDTIAIEVERIEESQRFNARLLSEGRSSLPGSERRP